ncbi:MAG: putative S-layer protein, partial [Nanoarchaeota archaeon]
MSLKSLSLFALSVFVVVLAMGIASAATLANWNFEDSNLIVDSGTGTLTLSDNRTATFPAGNAPSTVAAMSSTGWDVANRYIELDLSTVGFENLILRFDEQRSATGPTAFQIQYSSDGTTFTNLGSTTSTITTFTANPMHTFDFSAVTAIDNNINTEFRILVPTGSTASDSAGTFRIDNLLVEGTATTVQTSVPPEVTSCSSTGNPGDLEVRGISFQNNGLQYNNFGKDDEWFPFEEIEAEIKVENNGNNDVDDISVEWGIWDTDKNQWVIDLDEEDEINLKDGKDETLTFTFTIDDDMDAGLDELSDGDKYRFYVVATGTVDNSTSPETCASDFEQTSIVIESDFVVLDNFDVPETVQCGETATITADAWNVGDNDQDEVSVLVSNREMDISEDVLAGDIDAFDNQKVSFTFAVPSDADEKSYGLNFEVLDEDSDVYKNDLDDDLSEFTVPLQVSGNCGEAEAGAGETSVVAEIVSGGRAGQELVVRVTVTNNGNTQKTYALNVAGYSDLASSFSLDKNSLSLGAGQSGDVEITLDVNSDAAGSKTFFLE